MGPRLKETKFRVDDSDDEDDGKPRRHSKQAEVDDNLDFTDDGVYFTIAFVAFQAFLILMYGLFVEYDLETVSGNPTISLDATYYFQSLYPQFQDIHVMVFIGFGFLMTYLRTYSYGAVGFTFMIGTLGLQWGVLTVNFWLRAISLDTPWKKIGMTVDDLINADFAVASVLISFGAIIGRATPSQILFVTIAEILLYGLNNAIVVREGLSDSGGTYVIHMFGAYFGLTVSRILSWKTGKQIGWDDNTAQYHSDVFAMFGSVFLWLYWPSYNAARAGDFDNARHRAVVNTVLGISASAFMAFVYSRYLRGGNFNMTDIQNATLAGGVAMGSVCTMIPNPWGALVIGSFAGFLSVYGYNRIMVVLERRFDLFDTCGINNLHGIPSIFGALSSVVVTGVSTHAQFGGNSNYSYVYSKAYSWTPLQQALVQFYCIFITIGIAIAGGIVTGLIVRSSLFERLSPLYSDATLWEEPAPIDYKPSKRQKAGARHRGILGAKKQTIPRKMRADLLTADEVVAPAAPAQAQAPALVPVPAAHAAPAAVEIQVGDSRVQGVEISC